eukprot:TRINITY_DN5728_c0_g1_i1.p1 TRINITY_DN5728_c0_g1~~TRINITY_DN5728_c0_g1_i1.p1  ORF type:complete len:124 (+),score=20.64 TRINITY_DN5728_c0_g1_i1:58-429(+)
MEGHGENVLPGGPCGDLLPRHGLPAHLLHSPGHPFLCCDDSAGVGHTSPQGEKLRLSDGLFSVAHGLIMTLMEALLSGLLFSSYIHIHQAFCIHALPWDYTATWVCAAIGIDFLLLLGTQGSS